MLPEECVARIGYHVVNIGSLDVSEVDILEAISDFDNSNKPDSDGISTFLLRNCDLAFCEPLKILLKNSLVTGRPIAKLSNVSKLPERIIAKKVSFLMKSYISPNQHGFMPGRSTATNLVAFSNFCTHAFERHSQVDVTYTDFAKAFDKVSHCALEAKLHRLGIHSSMLCWFMSYLEQREYVVLVNGKQSDPYLATSGPGGFAAKAAKPICLADDKTSVYQNFKRQYPS
ncbi:uncharacterized protein LOC121405332 [Drosophila obscura]|uniref:uncharacterized protein LOC121405332 n=1 Tax=Drosophila obscura TaxID=7282 RepID=UPI001BB2245F|nr:uncharacterized protein LOC121405332 [Drosophila obscura]